MAHIGEAPEMTIRNCLQLVQDAAIYLRHEEVLRDVNLLMQAVNNLIESVSEGNEAVISVSQSRAITFYKRAESSLGGYDGDYCYAKYIRNSYIDFINNQLSDIVGKITFASDTHKDANIPNMVKSAYAIFDELENITRFDFERVAVRQCHIYREIIRLLNK